VTGTRDQTADHAPSASRMMTRPMADQLDVRTADRVEGRALFAAPVGEPAVESTVIDQRELLDALGVAVYTTDAAGRISDYNAAAVELWGRTPLPGERWCGSYLLFDRDGVPLAHVDSPVAVALREGRTIRGAEIISERQDGTRIRMLPYPSPIRDREGRLMGMVCVLVDVTQLREAEDTLRMTRSALDRSNSAREEFLGLVSHELRTPITTVFGNANILDERYGSIPEADRRAMIHDLAEDSARLRYKIENLLTLSSRRQERPPDLEPQLLNHLVRASVDSFTHRRTDRTVLVEGHQTRMIVDSDAAWLELVLENLLSNADKYSDPETVIEVVLEQVGNEAQVRVLDRGIGLEEAAPDAPFERFYRGRIAAQRANGLGIGLAVCKRLIEALGGRIWANPRQGGGTEVGFSLPILVDNESI
jgi:PAS domain S-box-containing protein